MKEKRIPLEHFNLDAFVDKTIEYLKTQVPSRVDPTYGIVRVKTPGDLPVYGPETGWDVTAALTEEGWMLFFPFAHTEEDGFLTCADGASYETHDEEGIEDEILIGPEDSVGYLVRVENGLVIINSGIHAGGACVGPLPSVDLSADRTLPEKPMVRFIEGFVRPEARERGSLMEEHLRSQGWRASCAESSPTLRNVDFDAFQVEEVFLPDARIVGVLRTKPFGSSLEIALEEAKHGARILEKTTRSEGILAFAGDGKRFLCHNPRARAGPLHLPAFPTPRQLNEFLHPETEEFQGTLRSYQRDSVAQVALCVMSGRRRMYLQMAGGAGKTIIAAAVISKLSSMELIGKTLFLVDREALASQTVKKFSTHLGERFSVGRARGVHEDKEKDILVSTVQHLAAGKRYAGYDPSHFDLVIIDECHRSYFGAWLPVLSHFSENGAILLGMTATPSDRETVNTDLFFTEPDHYPGPVFRYSMRRGETNPEVPEWDRLASCEYHGVDTDVDLKAVPDLEFDFESEQLGKAVDVPERNRLVAETYFEEILQDGEPVKTIVFAASISHAESLRRALTAEYNRRHDLPEDHPAAGKLIVAVHNETPNALDTIERFQQTTDAGQRRDTIAQAMTDPKMSPRPLVLVGVGMLDTGIDVPDLEVLLMARPTMSKVLYAQMKGRGTRRCRETGKASYKLVDFIDLPGKRPVVTNDTLVEEDEAVEPERIPAPVEEPGERSAGPPPEASELFEILRGRLDSLMDGEILRIRFAQASLSWRRLRGDSPMDEAFLTAMGFDLQTLCELYGEPDASLEDIVSLAIGEVGYPAA